MFRPWGDKKKKEHKIMTTFKANTARIIAAALGATALLGAPAFAQDVKSNEFKFSREQLSTSDGAEQVLKDIEAEARRVCSNGHVRLTATEFRQMKACTQATVANAVNQIASPQLDVAMQERNSNG